MKLLVPCLGELEPGDRRLVRLAEFLGIEATQVPLAKQVRGFAEYLEKTLPQRDACVVVNPRVLQSWVGSESLPEDLASFLTAHFAHLLVHSLSPGPFDSSVIRGLSHGALDSVHNVESARQPYDISPDSKDVCAAFAGLSFGHAAPTNDQVLSRGSGEREARTLISISKRPLMTVQERETRSVWFLGSKEIVDLNATVGGAPVSSYFSRLLPPAMALRSIFAEESWRPGQPHASVIIDDPLLRLNYGALNFESLLALMKQHNFHSTIAFIPHNFKRSSPRITRMFRENANRFSLCFHGNDHTRAEFASKDIPRLNTLFQIAEHRMERHKKITGVEHDRVMVFPQGHFSVEAMDILKSRNFYGAVNTTPHPMNQADQLSLAEMAQPALLRYGNFPLFLRKDCLSTQCEDIAFNCFFGRPVLIVEHHDIFERPDLLAEVADRVNKVAPGIRWSSLGTILQNSILSKRSPDGVIRVRAYSSTVQLTNNFNCSNRYSIEWWHPAQNRTDSVQVHQGGTPASNFTTDSEAVRLTLDLLPGASQTLSLVHPISQAAAGSLGLRHNTKAFVRRRLSEVRDNYLSKNPRVLAAAKTFQRRLTH